MTLQDQCDELSRAAAKALFPLTSNGRTLSRMTADRFGTDTDTVHTVGLAIIATVVLSNYINAR